MESLLAVLPITGIALLISIILAYWLRIIF